VRGTGNIARRRAKPPARFMELSYPGTFVPWNFFDTGNYGYPVITQPLILTYSAYSSAKKAPILCHSLDVFS